MSESKARLTKVVRAYKIKVYPTLRKRNDLEWVSHQYGKFVNAYSNHLFFAPPVLAKNKKGETMEVFPTYSTEGMGQLVNQAQRKARGIVDSAQESAKATGNKCSPPKYKKTACPGSLQKNESDNDKIKFYVKVSVAFGNERAKPMYLPAKSHKALNKAIKQGWELSDQCEVFKDKNGEWYALVYVSKKVHQKSWQECVPYGFKGADVGIRNGIATSDGHLGPSMRPAIKKCRDCHAERRRQLALRSEDGIVRGEKSISKASKSFQKQLLDVEAHLYVDSAVKAGWPILVVEDPKVLANLTGQNQWARAYFARRVQCLAREVGLVVISVHPAYTSQKCPCCGFVHRQNRRGTLFRCVDCGHSGHADLIASGNIASKGRLLVLRFLSHQRLSKRQNQVAVSSDKVSSL